MRPNLTRLQPEISSCISLTRLNLTPLLSVSFQRKEKPMPYQKVDTETSDLITLSNERGQGLIEYLIIVALVAIATIGIVRVLGQAVGAKFNTITYALQGQKKSFQIDNMTQEQWKKKDLSNFMNGVSSSTR